MAVQASHVLRTYCAPLPRQVHHPATALLPLEGVAQAQLADAANPVWWDEREQREGCSVTKGTALCCRCPRLRSIIQLVRRSDPCLLHVFPFQPPAHSLLVHLLSFGRLLCLAPQIDELGEGVWVCTEDLDCWFEIGIDVGRKRDKAVEVIGDGRVLAMLSVLQPCGVVLY